jgi:hypothetical protein
MDQAGCIPATRWGDTVGRKGTDLFAFWAIPERILPAWIALIWPPVLVENKERSSEKKKNLDKRDPC